MNFVNFKEALGFLVRTLNYKKENYSFNQGLTVLYYRLQIVASDDLQNDVNFIVDFNAGNQA